MGISDSQEAGQVLPEVDRGEHRSGLNGSKGDQEPSGQPSREENVHSFGAPLSSAHRAWAPHSLQYGSDSGVWGQARLCATSKGSLRAKMSIFLGTLGHGNEFCQNKYPIWSHITD